MVSPDEKEENPFQEGVVARLNTVAEHAQQEAVPRGGD